MLSKFFSMERDISYMFSDQANASEPSDAKSFKIEVEKHYYKSYMWKNITTPFKLTSSFLVATLGFVQASAFQNLGSEPKVKINFSLNMAEGIIPLVTALIVSFADSTAEKADNVIKSHLQRGISSQFFKIPLDILELGDSEENKKFIMYELGLNK